MAKPFLSVIIPAYNEAERIPKTLLDIDKYLSQAGFSYEIIVVNDGSKDKTAEVVEKMKSLVKNLKLIDNKVNQGKGGVVAQGMLDAKGMIRLFADADNSTPIEQIEKFFPYFKEGYDVVIGSRAMKDSQLAVKQPFYRQILGRVGNLIIRLLAVPGIKDTQCGFKAFTEKAAEKIFPQLTIKRWGFDVEVLVIARLLGYRIKEVGIRWINDPHSKVKASAFFEVLAEVIKIRLNIWRKKYSLN
ncbi:MAG: dolichyl-phosphate beta-glucosyltransferase [Minisyncoccia bacterium]